MGGWGVGTGLGLGLDGGRFWGSDDEHCASARWLVARDLDTEESRCMQKVSIPLCWIWLGEKREMRRYKHLLGF